MCYTNSTVFSPFSIPFTFSPHLLCLLPCFPSLSSLIMWARLKPPSTLSCRLRGLRNPQQMRERVFVWLHAVDRQHSFKYENKAISSWLCRDGMHEFIDRVGKKKNLRHFLCTCLTFSSNLSTRNALSKQHGGKCKHFVPVTWELLSWDVAHEYTTKKWISQQPSCIC